MHVRMQVIAAVAGLLVGGLPVLGQGPTKLTDPMPPFNLEYFVGTWAFDWAAPETPLGPGGDLVGTITYTLVKPPLSIEPLNGFPALSLTVVPEALLREPVVVGRIEATGPQGAIKGRAILAHTHADKRAVRYEVDSRGMSLTQIGTFGGDLGGTYTFFWEAAPIKKDGQTVQLRGRTTTYSPLNFRDQIQYSVDGGPFRTYGQPWYQKKP